MDVTSKLKRRHYAKMCFKGGKIAVSMWNTSWSFVVVFYASVLFIVNMCHMTKPLIRNYILKTNKTHSKRGQKHSGYRRCLARIIPGPREVYWTSAWQCYGESAVTLLADEFRQLLPSCLQMLRGPILHEASLSPRKWFGLAKKYLD